MRHIIRLTQRRYLREMHIRKATDRIRRIELCAHPRIARTGRGEVGRCGAGGCCEGVFEGWWCGVGERVPGGDFGARGYHYEAVCAVCVDVEAGWVGLGFDGEVDVCDVCAGAHTASFAGAGAGSWTACMALFVEGWVGGVVCGAAAGGDEGGFGLVELEVVVDGFTA